MKIPDTIFKTKDLDLIEFGDYAQVILNRGLYEFRIFDQVPDWTANNGENGIFTTGTVSYLYFHLNGVWLSIGFNSIGALVLFDSDGDTGITPEATPDEDVIRFYTAGVYKFGMSTYGFFMSANTPVVFDGTAGDTQWLYDSADSYLKAYVDGTLRMEM